MIGVSGCFLKRQAVSVIYLFAVSSAKVSCRPLVRVGCSTHARKSDNTLSGFHGEYLYLVYTMTVLPSICLCAGRSMRFRLVLAVISGPTASHTLLLREFKMSSYRAVSKISPLMATGGVRWGEARMRRMWGFRSEANHG